MVGGFLRLWGRDDEAWVYERTGHTANWRPAL